jgi:purine-binding chemotaxis protein CheW
MKNSLAMKSTATSGQFCTFWVAGHLFGVPICAVQEVLLSQPVTPVPLAPAEIPGLINLRGQIVTVLDLRARLRLHESSRERTGGGVNVIVVTSDAPVSLLADRIGEVITPDEGRFEPPPDTLDRGVRDLVSQVYKLDEQLMLVLDIDNTTAVGGAA